VLTAARLTRQKGIEYLLQAASQVQGADFVIAGDGPERGELEAQAGALGVADRAIFAGHRADMPELLSECDLFVLPSLFEGLPLAVLEAMAAGKPVVATDVGGTAEAVLNGETGLIVPPRDAGALAMAIRRVLDKPEWATAMGAAGRERARCEFSAETMVRRTTEVYEAILGRRQSR
jgi:glycosyltransferase involved in cell wall biosynthesis